MTSDTKISPIAEDLSQMQIVAPIPCEQCGYSLYGLHVVADWPECAKPVRLTIFEAIDPAASRLGTIRRSKTVGNSLALTVLFFLGSMLFAIVAAFLLGPNPLFLIRPSVATIDVSILAWCSAIISLVGLLAFVPLVCLRCKDALAMCRSGIELTSIGLLAWTISLMTIAVKSNEWSFPPPPRGNHVGMLYDTLIPSVACMVVFLGFQRFIPRLGQRSFAFRQAKASRQRMNSLLVTLAFLVVGRTILAFVQFTPIWLRVFGTVLVLVSMILLVIGLLTLLLNVLWIRKSLISPPPTLAEIVKPI